MTEAIRANSYVGFDSQSASSSSLRTSGDRSRRADPFVRSLAPQPSPSRSAPLTSADSSFSRCSEAEHGAADRVDRAQAPQGPFLSPPCWPPLPSLSFIAQRPHPSSCALQRGFQFNVIVVGQTGLGKSTLINTLFASHLVDSKGRLEADEPVRSTTEIVTHSHSQFIVSLVPRLGAVELPSSGTLAGASPSTESARAIGASSRPAPRALYNMLTM